MLSSVASSASIFRSPSTRRLATVVAGLTVLMMLSGIATAQVATRNRLPNLDVRTDEAQASGAVKARVTRRVSAQNATLRGITNGVAQLSKDIPDVKIATHELLGVPKMITSAKGAITPPNPGAKPDQVVRGFLNARAAAFGLAVTSVDQQAKTEASYKNPENALQWVTMTQEVGGVPVFQGELRAGVSQKGEILAMVNDFAPGLDESMAAASASLITPEEAALAAAAGTNYQLQNHELVRNYGDTARNVSFMPTKSITTLDVSQSLFPLAPGDATLAWQVVVVGQNGAYIVLVDANSGDLLFRKDCILNQTQSATYEFYDAQSPAPLCPLPDDYPVTTAPMTDGKQASGIQRSLLTVVSEAPEGDAEGWIRDGNALARGNNTWSGRHLSQAYAISPDPFVEGRFAMPYGNALGSSPAQRNFVYRDDGGLAWQVPPTGFASSLPHVLTQMMEGIVPYTAVNEPYDSGAVTNLFVWVNRFHDITYRLGFTEQARNYQTSNFNRGGLSGDGVVSSLCRVHYDTYNNAYFMPLPDGYSGIADLGQNTGPHDSGEPVRDFALENDAVIHELTHGMSCRIVGNTVGLAHMQGGALGEGWSDFYGLSITNKYPASRTEDSRNPDKIYPSGGWVTYHFGGLGSFDNYFYGIRRFPYSTDLQVNPVTWADADPGQYYVSDGKYPESPICWTKMAGVLEVHNLGEFWANVLWQVRGEVLNRFKKSRQADGYKTGNEHMLQLVTDAMKLTPNQPSFVDGRNAMLAAAIAQGDALSPDPAVPGDPNTSLAAIDELSVWKGFAKRGLGYSSKAPTGLDDGQVTYISPTNYYTISNRYYYDAPTTGIPLTVPHNGSTSVPMNGQSVTFFGQRYSSVYVNSNGNLTFGSGDSTPETNDPSERCQRHFSRPRLSGLMCDLDTEVTGTVEAYMDLDFLTVNFNGVPEAGTQKTNTFTMSIGLSGGLYEDVVMLRYANIQSKNALVGLSRTLVNSVPCPESDLSAFATGDCTTPKIPDYFTENFTNNDFDLSGRILTFERAVGLGWKSRVVEAFDYPVTATTSIVSDGGSGGNGNGQIEAGETIQVQMPFENQFARASLSNVVGVLTCNAPGVVVLNPVSSYGSVGPQSGSMGTPYEVRLDSNTPCGAEIPLTFTFTNDQQIPAMATHTIRVMDNIGAPQQFTWPQVPAYGLVSKVLKNTPSVGTPTSSDLQLSASQEMKKNTVLRNDTTGENLLVTLFTAPTNVVTVTRGYNGTAVQDIATSDVLSFVSVTVPDANSVGTSTDVIVPDSITSVGLVTVRLNTITHPRVGELSVKLTSPDGSVISLVDRVPNGSASSMQPNIYNVTLMDASLVSVQAQTNLSSGGIFKPAEPFSSLRGKKASGVWRLTVADNYAQHTGGQVASWSISISPMLTPCGVAATQYASDIAEGSSSGWTVLNLGDSRYESSYYRSTYPQALVMNSQKADASIVRMPGYQSPGVPYVNYPNQIYRFKAMVCRTDQQSMTDNKQIPGLMLRTMTRFAQGNSVYWQFSPHDDQYNNAVMAANAPSTNRQAPTEYHVDLNPVDVPALEGQVVRGYAYSVCTFPEQNGNLEVMEASLSRFSAPSDDQGTVLCSYSGMDFSEGNIFNYNLSNPDPATDFPHQRAEVTTDTFGVTIDTRHIPTPDLGCVLYDFVPPSHVEPYIQANKMYRVRYHVTSNTPADNNPQIRLRARTVKFSQTASLLVGGAKACGSVNNTIAAQTQPGPGTQNPAHIDQERQGGYYDLYFESPRVMPDQDYLRRLRFGFDVFDGEPGGNSFANSVNGRVTLDSLEVMEFNKVE